MTPESLRTAIAEAERFLKKARDAQKRFDREWVIESKRLALTNKESFTVSCKENGAVKRASLDLTRALADLRRAR